MRGNSLRSNPRPANSMEQDSFDSFDDEEMLVMSANSSLRLSPPTPGSPQSLAGANRDAIGRLRAQQEQDSELPRSVIVTSVDLSVFDDENTKAAFESAFREFEAGAAFHYLRSFRRVRVDFDSHLSASNAKANMDGTPFGNGAIHCYFIQVLSPVASEDAFLHVPPLEKQFLISPPCSPPVGWEQPREDRPVVDCELLAAMAELTPGEKHELHPTKQINVLGKSVSTPSIVVHIADEDDFEANDVEGMRIPRIRVPAGACGGVPNGSNGHHNAMGKKIRPTRCPDRQSSLD